MKRVLGMALALGGLAMAGSGARAAAQTVHTATGCPNCHQLHGASGSTLTNYAIAEDLCLSCHTDGANPNAPSGVSTHLSPKYVANDSAATCVQCHGHRGQAGGNLALIRDSVRTPNSGKRDVIFTSRGTDAVAGTWPSTLPGAGPGLNSFADGNATYDGVCEVCHTQTVNHQNGTVLPDNSNHAHNAGLQCTRCHLHSGGFKGGGPCSACHDTGGQGTTGPNSRRPIIPEMARASHHVGSTYQDTDCRTCHDMSQHQQGTVRLKNQDDTTIVYALAGNPLTDSAVARTLTPFCLSCHDGSAGGRAKPFSDSVAVPVVDTARWRLAAHQTAAPVAGCFGDGSFGCHGTAHGSQKVKLLGLQPAVSPDSGSTPGYYQEEGFCFNCHRSGGAAANKDMLTRFSRPINWVAQATGLYNSTNLNDRHDVQRQAQLRGGIVIECTSCHDPHAATAARPWRPDPDPTDGHVPGTNWYFTGYQTAGDTLSEFCLDCHDRPWARGTPGDTVTDIRATWVNDGMGARTSTNVNLEAGVGWAIGDVIPCRACHLAHVRPDRDFADTTNLFQAVDTVRAKAASPPYWNGAYLQGYTGNTTKSFAYGVITNANTTNPQRDAATWCNTCHARTAMLSKDNCFTCHKHGDGGRF